MNTPPIQASKDKEPWPRAISGLNIYFAMPKRSASQALGGFVDEFEVLRPQVSRALWPNGKHPASYPGLNANRERNLLIDVEMLLRVLLEPDDLKRFLESARDETDADLEEFRDEQLLALCVVTEMLAEHAQPSRRLRAAGRRINRALDRT